MTLKPDRDGMDDLFSLVYEELRRLAAHILRAEQSPQISPTTLVNEAWLKLAGSPQLAETSPLHFRRIAGRAMRQVIVDAARRRQAAINGGGLVRVPFEVAIEGVQSIQDRDLLALDAALNVLEQKAPRQAAVVDARFFGGFSCGECAEMFGVSEATVMREWRLARALLAREIKRTPSAAPDLESEAKDLES